MLDGVGLGDVLDADVAKEGGLPRAAPGAVLHIGELGFGVQKVLVAAQQVADLVQVVAVELLARAPEDHVRERLPHRHLLRAGAAFTAGIFLHGGLAGRLKVLTGKQAVVALEVKFQLAAVQPVHDPAGLLRGDQLVHDHRAVVLHIAAVAADHPVQADVPQRRIDLGLAASGADVHPVAGGPCGTDGPHRRFGQVVFVVHQGAVHVDEKDLVHDVFSFLLVLPVPPGSFFY